VLYDEGLVTHPEPFKQLFNQGMLTAYAYKDSTGRLLPVSEVALRDGKLVVEATGEEPEQVVAKMSKTLKNVVNPDQVIEQYGCDTFRLYEMFMGPLADSKPWNPRDVPGCRRFLDRLWRTYVDPDGTEPIRPRLLVSSDGKPEGETLRLERELNKALKRIDDSFEHFNFNTAIAAMMSFLNEVGKSPEAFERSQAERLVQALAPFAPHVAEELWERLGHGGGISYAPWPLPEPEYLVEDEFELVIQVQGKLRGRVSTSKQASKEELLALAREAVAAQLEGKQIVKEIVVPGKLVNFVVR
jgi:leucyl-tRNA synthetase